MMLTEDVRQAMRDDTSGGVEFSVCREPGCANDQDRRCRTGLCADHNREQRTNKQHVNTPCFACVYTLFDAAGNVLYVGKSIRVRQRIKEHAASKQWWPMVARVVVDVYESESAALNHEAWSIWALRPPFNIDKPLPSTPTLSPALAEFAGPPEVLAELRW